MRSIRSLLAVLLTAAALTFGLLVAPPGTAAVAAAAGPAGDTRDAPGSAVAPVEGDDRTRTPLLAVAGLSGVVIVVGLGAGAARMRRVS